MNLTLLENWPHFVNLECASRKRINFNVRYFILYFVDWPHVKNLHLTKCPNPLLNIVFSLPKEGLGSQSDFTCFSSCLKWLSWPSRERGGGVMMTVQASHSPGKPWTKLLSWKLNKNWKVIKLKKKKMWRKSHGIYFDVSDGTISCLAYMVMYNMWDKIGY